jgi:16S rRNA (guanine966-N2)-methyltransferase
VERDPRAARLIATNLERCGVVDRYAIIRAAFAGIEGPPGEAFDIVFLDPPYGAADLMSALEAGQPLVTAGTLLIIEHAQRDRAPAECGALVRTREVASGDSALSFYSLKP